VRLEYDPDANAADLRLRHAVVTGTREVAPGVLLDLAADGRPVGFELLDASEILDGRPDGVTFEFVTNGRPPSR
jgi:uncharacterized protein YuzE